VLSQVGVRRDELSLVKSRKDGNSENVWAKYNVNTLRAASLTTATIVGLLARVERAAMLDSSRRPIS
jgi:hypothetical protein